MELKIPRYGTQRRIRLLRRGEKTGSLTMYRRFQIVFLLTGRLPVKRVAELMGVARSTVYDVAHRFLEGGPDALEDRRRYNGRKKKNGNVTKWVAKMVSERPTDYGWARPTWTRELLCRTLARKHRVHLSVSTMGRVLAELGARLGRPRPIVACPLPQGQREWRLRQIRRLERSLPSNEVLLYEDEVDIHLNPKIGRDWMMPGQQKLVLTPGKNEKRYIAGALNHHTGELVWVEGKSKASGLFCALVEAVMKRYGRKRRVHIVLDNYIIHSSKKTQKFLRQYGDRLVLHFLPPYCPNANRIERLWQDLHAAVTRNHDCRTMLKLMRRVRSFLNRVGYSLAEPARSRTYAAAA